ncbi:MAG: NRDE family protein [Flavobacteriaceae bacterium]|nr:NRDE family protein [Flavobacteriaceae bacterium]
MCTVTYIPINKTDFILTSSRDVPFTREKALVPKKYIEDNVAITYPKDGRAKGTWIGYSSKNRLICLLNGGFENHISKKSYRKSRGIIVKNLLKKDTISAALSKIELENIEPFTLIIADWNAELQLIEFIWDGKIKHLKNLNQEKHIWSSSTLYDENMKQLRRGWFSKWTLKDKKKDILKFHHKAGLGNCNVAITMKRKKVGTVSITQFSKIDGEICMNYEEITNAKN